MTALPISANVPAHIADRMNAPTDRDLLCDDIARSRRKELVADLVERMSDSDLQEVIAAKLESDAFLLTSLRNMARISACSLDKPDMQLMMCRLAATAGDSIRQAVDHAEGDDLVRDEAARLKEEG